ncbi:MAG: radical SAM protein [Candidatus Gracilibacteria bacterium]|nr:radical SAM protein [Candidatus Gracilibacteria bacterium]
MNFKRLEIYVGWTCNQKCTYCIEFPNMEKAWKIKVSKYDILKKLLKYKKLGYNHVTYLGGEPFIQPVFLDALILGKKLGYTILVTTNATTLHIDSQASKFLPYIDELFLSVEAIGIEEQQKISRTNNYVNWEGVFENIKKYWNGNLLKANIVITQDNKNNLFELVEFLKEKGVKEISITYPDVMKDYYTKEHILSKIFPRYPEVMEKVLPVIDYCHLNNIKLKVVDIPYCIFPKENLEEYIKITDDYDYGDRIKITYDENVLNRGKFEKKEDIPRERFWTKKCDGCKYKGKCWGPSIHYKWLYGFEDINPII